jgi:RimJ/RimL family protein N-acetyltransferase
MVADVLAPRLITPSVEFEASFLAGERERCELTGDPVGWLEVAARDFAAFAGSEGGVRTLWEVPSSLYWYVAGGSYIGTLVIRHRLTPWLAEAGGHIGYHVVPSFRRQGHATSMLAAGLEKCRELGISRVLLSCAIENDASRRVILANGGVPDGKGRGEDRFIIDLAGEGR